MQARWFHYVAAVVISAGLVIGTWALAAHMIRSNEEAQRARAEFIVQHKCRAAARRGGETEWHATKPHYRTTPRETLWVCDTGSRWVLDN